MQSSSSSYESLPLSTIDNSLPIQSIENVTENQDVAYARSKLNAARQRLDTCQSAINNRLKTAIEANLQDFKNDPNYQTLVRLKTTADSEVRRAEAELKIKEAEKDLNGWKFSQLRAGKDLSQVIQSAAYKHLSKKIEIAQKSKDAEERLKDAEKIVEAEEFFLKEYEISRLAEGWTFSHIVTDPTFQQLQAKLSEKELVRDAIRREISSLQDDDGRK